MGLMWGRRKKEAEKEGKDLMESESGGGGGAGMCDGREKVKRGVGWAEGWEERY